MGPSDAEYLCSCAIDFTRRRSTFPPAYPKCAAFYCKRRRSYSVINGERMFMEEGDFVVTYAARDVARPWPRRKRTYVLAGYSRYIPFIYATGGTFFEGHPEGMEPAVYSDNYSSKHYQGGLVRPIHDRKSKKAPVGAYKWEQTKAALEGMKEFEPDPFDGHAVEFMNPSDGKTANANITSWM